MRDYLALFGLGLWTSIMGGMALWLVNSRDRELEEEARREAEAAHPPTSAPESR